MSQDIAKAIRKEFTSSNPLPVSGGGGDANAENQATEIEKLSAINNVLGTINDETYLDNSNASVSARVKRIGTKLGEFINGTIIPSGGYGIGGVLSWIAQIINTRTPPTLGTNPSAQSFPVTLSNDGIFATSFGFPTDAVATSDTGIFSFLAFVKRLSATITNINSNLPSSTKPVLVRSMFKKWREDFNGVALDPAAWNVIQTGGGQSITVSSSELRITAGTTINSETIIKGLIPFTIPFRIQFQCYLSQRIANQEFYLEVTDATGNHKASILIEGTNNTLARVFATNEGIAGTAIGNSGFNASSSYSIFDLEVGDDEVNLYSKTSDAVAGRVAGAGVTLTRKLPNPNLEYFLQIRAKNLVSAPASSTTLYLDSILVTDHEEISAEITSARGGNGNSALPVFFSAVQSVNINNNPTINSITNTVNIAAATTKDFTSNTSNATPLAANATYTSSAFNTLSLNKLRGWVYSDQSGTLFIDFSITGTNWRTIQTLNYTANSVLGFEQPLSGVNYRVRYTNGATAQTTFELLFTQMGIGA